MFNKAFRSTKVFYKMGSPNDSGVIEATYLIIWVFLFSLKIADDNTKLFVVGELYVHTRSSKQLSLMLI